MPDNEKLSEGEVWTKHKMLWHAYLQSQHDAVRDILLKSDVAAAGTFGGNDELATKVVARMRRLEEALKEIERIASIASFPAVVRIGDCFTGEINKTE